MGEGGTLEEPSHEGLLGCERLVETIPARQEKSWDAM